MAGTEKVILPTINICPTVSWQFHAGFMAGFMHHERFVGMPWTQLFHWVWIEVSIAPQFEEISAPRFHAGFMVVSWPVSCLRSDLWARCGFGLFAGATAGIVLRLRSHCENMAGTGKVILPKIGFWMSGLRLELKVFIWRAT